MARKEESYGPNIVADPRRPGAFYVRIYHAGVHYKRRAASPSHARELREEIRVAIRKGEWPPKPKAKLALLDELLETYREEKQREGKAVMDSDVGFRRLLERFGGRRADSLTAREVKEWRDALLEGHTPATVNRHLTILRAILRMGMRDRKIEAGAIPEIEPFAENNKRVRYLTADEELRLLEKLPEWLRPLVMVAIHTGMRRGELLNLMWADVDFVGGIIFVRTSKSGEGRRIPMSPTAHRTLSALREARRKRLKARVVRREAANPHVFSAPQGGLILNLNRVWYGRTPRSKRAVGPVANACPSASEGVIKRAGLEGLRFHDLRHTFASRLVMNGVDLFRVQTLMGHKSPMMTLRYAHLSPEHLRAAVATLDAPGVKPWAEERQGS
ncbi:site-specific integrase [Candidatus Binatus sp.]|uniref:tyrosine-type recombinase/integrase n=1 Tax=Candidatus Binatus sp. TaxID=2811406 RepID=UPI002F92ED57